MPEYLAICKVSSGGWSGIIPQSSSPCCHLKSGFHQWNVTQHITLSFQRYRWRGAGIKRSESARLINMRQPSLQPRQNSHPNLVNQTSFSSSSSSLADRSSIDSPSKLTTYSLSNTDYHLQVELNTENIWSVNLVEKYFWLALDPRHVILSVLFVSRHCLHDWCLSAMSNIFQQLFFTGQSGKQW